MNIIQAHKNLQSYIEKENFTGYDPYDTLNSFIPFHKLGKWPPVLAIQFQKLNPINIRPLLGIKKGINPKAFGLLLQAYSIIYQNQPSPEIKATCDYLFNWLSKNTSKGYKNACWGYNFPWASSEKYLPEYSPTAVVTGFICRGLYEYSKISADPKISQLVNSAANFVKENLHTFTLEKGKCISYTTLQADCCYNASLLAAEVLLYDYQLNNAEDNLQLIDDCVKLVLNKQESNGLWKYSMDVKSGKERIQTDFHQGYVLDSLHILNKVLKKQEVELAISKGMEYYNKYQFLPNGASLYRIPKVWPVDIHNQAQGIISHVRFRQLNPYYIKTAKNIANYTINAMQSKHGYFYYRLFKNYKIKIPYIRWSQAWMFLALTQLIFDNN